VVKSFGLQWRQTNVKKIAPFICGITVALAATSWSSLPAIAQTIQPIKRFSRDTSLKPDGKGDKIDFAHRASDWYLRGATVLDMSSTAIGLEHSHGVEVGWAKCFGSKNTPAILAGNVGLNIGVEYLSRKIDQRGGRWRMVAMALNGAKATGNAAAGIRNMRYIAEH
jgi:hypothetical protein